MKTDLADSSTAIVLTTTHPRAQCMDVRATFGRRFRYTRDDSSAAERSAFRTVETPCLSIIPCRFGKIFRWGGRVLAAYCPAGPAKRRALADLDGATVVQGVAVGCPEVVVTFDVNRIDQVAAVLHARRPRAPLSEVARPHSYRRARAWIGAPSRSQDGRSAARTMLDREGCRASRLRRLVNGTLPKRAARPMPRPPARTAGGGASCRAF